jgi:DNA-binding MarR family transcriptional regulator
MKSRQQEIVAQAERLRRQFLDIVQFELDCYGIRDINSVQALIVDNIGESEMSVSELMWRGCYMGSNVSYNLKKLTEVGYLVQQRSSHDRRVTIVRASQKGKDLCAALDAMNARHMDSLVGENISTEDIDTCLKTLRSLQRFWSRAIDSRLQKPAIQA